MSQAIVSFVVDVTRLSCYSYYVLTAYRDKTSYQQTVDTFIFQCSLVLSYINYGESFYTNTLTSALFRKVFRETVGRYCRWIAQRMIKWPRAHNRIVPSVPSMHVGNAFTDQNRVQPIGQSNSHQSKPPMIQT